MQIHVFNGNKIENQSKTASVLVFIVLDKTRLWVGSFKMKLRPYQDNVCQDHVCQDYVCQNPVCQDHVC